LNTERPTLVIIYYNYNLENHQLILSCTFDKIIHFEVFPGINNSNTFELYMYNLLEEVKKNFPDLSRVYFFLDHSMIHDSDRIYTFFKNHDLKILWGVNGFSNFDFCEYIFRLIKLNHYKNIYKNR